MKIKLCPHCNKPVTKSENPEYSWECNYCDEDFYDFECDEIDGVFGYYYQIDYIDSKGLANYIDTSHDREEAIKQTNILNQANYCLHKSTKFVLDKYRYIINVDETDEIIETNITDAKTINERINGD